MYNHNIGTDQKRRMYLRDGNMLFGRQFLEVFPFTEGLGAVRDRNGAYFIDEEGRPAIRERYRGAYPFRDGKAAVEDSLGMFHIGKDGKQLYSRRFGWVSDYSEGLCAVRYLNGSYTFIDGNGNPWERTFRYAEDFREGTALALDDEGFTHIGTDGKPVHGKHFTEARGFCHGRAPVRDENGWFLIDTKGEKVSEYADRIDEGRNGLFTGVKDDRFGYFTKEGVFSTLFEYPQEIRKPDMPAWTDDILSHEWDSCIVFMRHGERKSHYICTNGGMNKTNLTVTGEDDTRNIGRKISSLNWKKVSGYCSPVPRCVTTANCIMAGMGVPAKVEVSQEIGPRATAFVGSDEPDWSNYDRPLILAMYEQLKGNLIPEWFDNERIYANLMGIFRKRLNEQDSLTFMVNHDCFVMYLVGYVLGKYPRNRWPDYCEGALVVRRGTEYFLVFEGTEYPLPERMECRVDTSLEPTGTKVEIIADEPERGWESCPKEDIVWIGDPSENFFCILDKEGRFSHGRTDNYLAYNLTYNYAGDFSEQCAVVYRRGRGASYVTDFGDYLHNRWFLDCRDYSEGLSAVRTSEGWTYIDSEANKALNGIFDRAEPFNHGQALVFVNGRPCRTGRSGQITEL